MRISIAEKKTTTRKATTTIRKITLHHLDYTGIDYVKQNRKCIKDKVIKRQ